MPGEIQNNCIPPLLISLFDKVSLFLWIRKMHSCFLRFPFRHKSQINVMSKNSLFLTAIIFVVILFTCSKPSPIGGDLLGADQVNVLATDTLTLIAQTIDEDSVLVFSPGSEIPSVLFGNYEDPVFGNINASVYTQIRFNNDTRGPDIDSAAVLDSVVFAIAYDTLSVYGDFSQPQQLEIFRLTETMDPAESYFSNVTFGFDPNPLGGLFNFIPRPFDNVDVMFPSGDTIATASIHPHLRVRLDDAFGEYLISLKDSSGIYTDQDSFKNALRGFHFRQTGAETNSVLAFDLLNTINRDQITGLWLYYHEDTIARSYRFRIDNDDARLTNFVQDDESSIANAFANDPILGDSLVFIQGMVGKNIQIDFPHADNLGQIAVNKAELELTVANLPGDNENLDPSSRIFAYFINDSGELEVIDDIAIDRGILTSLSAFDGRLREEEDELGMTVQRYRLNLSTFFQKIAEGEQEKTIYLQLALAVNFTKEIIPSRSVLFGPGHSEYPMKLKLFYTEVE